MANPKVIGIRFGDNDFRWAIEVFLMIIKETGIDEYYPLTKTRLVALFNKSMPGIYFCSQNRADGREYPVGDTYLTITEDKVYFDKEVMRFIEGADNGWFNGEYHVLDTHNGYIYTI